MISSQSKVVNISPSESLRRLETSRVLEIRKISTTEYCARTSFPWHSVEFRLDGFFLNKIMIRIYQHAYFSACILAAQLNVSRAEKAPQTLGLSHELYYSNQWVRKQVSTPISRSTSCVKHILKTTHSSAMDPLSLSASLIAVLQITGSLISFCYDYRQGVKHASKEIVQISDELNSLRDILDSLLKIAERAESNGFSQLSTFELLLKDDGPLFVCKTELEKLRGKLEKGGVGGSEGWRAVRERLVWPLKEGEVRKTLVVLDRLKSTLALGLSADQT